MSSDEKEQSRKQIFLVLLEKPRLCPHGLSPYNIKGDGQTLLDDQYLEQFEICKQWLSQIDRTKTIRKYIGSYRLKHIVEDCTGKYVCNGAFIAAAIHLKIPIQPIRVGSPNAYLAISTKHVRQILKKARPKIVGWGRHF